jgi:hypothetical protein
MRQVHFITEKGRTAELLVEQASADERVWGGFNAIHSKAAELLKDDVTDAWVMISEGTHPCRYECKAFRGWYVANDYLKA